MPQPRPPLVTATLAGAAVMALELLLPRLVARHVGTSLEVWTAVFAVVLVGIALGNAWGGRLAGTGASRTGWVLGGAAGAVAAIPSLDGLAAELLRGAPLLARTLLGIAITALPATILLGAVSPLLAAQAVRGSLHPGRVLGLLSAAGALGSLVGTYAAGFALIPSFPTTTGIHGLAVALALLGAAQLLRARRAPPPPEPLAPRASAAPPVGRDPPTISPARATLLALASGAAVLVLEVVAGRTAGRLVGNGLYTWTAIIGAILLGLAGGNAIGGRLADRPDLRRTFARAALAASVLVMLALWTPLVLLNASPGSGPALPLRIALGAVAAFTPAALALGTLPPLLARAALSGGPGDGRVIGRIWAATTLGAVVGSLATGPLLLPGIGSSATLGATAAGLALLPLGVGRRIEWPWLAGVVAVSLCAVLPFDAARSAGLKLAVREDAPGVYVRETRYFHLRVDTPPPPPGVPAPASAGRIRRLALDGFVHGFVHLDDPTWLGYGYEGLYACVTDRVAPKDRPWRALFIGGGAYTFPRRLRVTHPEAALDVAEIDPAVTRAGHEALGLPADPGFRIFHEDARTFVRDLPADAPPYDLVYGDAYTDYAAPFHLTTVEYARAVKAHMAPGGVYLCNLIDAWPSGRFVGAFAATAREVFAHVALVGLERGGTDQDTFLLVASDRELDLEGLVRPDPSVEGGTRTLPVIRFTDAELESLVRRADGLVLRDDYAPVESLLAPVFRLRSRR